MIKKVESAQNPLVKHLVKLRQDRSYRYENKLVFVEGKNLIQELTSAVRLFALNENDFPTHLKAEESFLVSPSVMQKISGVKSPEGIIAEVQMPKEVSLLQKRFLLAIDGISDPGNLGTLLRTALAFGWEGAFILEGSCDPFNEKALRAAKGATFRLPLVQGTWEALLQSPLPRYVADLKGKSMKELPLEKGAILVLSNESQGASLKAKTLCQPITLPMSNEMESLNVAVAGGILMYGMKGNNV